MLIFGGSLSVLEYSNEIYVLDLDSSKWIKASPNGTIPKPRHGHSFTNFALNKMLLFGGYNFSQGESDFYNDMHILNTETFTWEKVESSGSIPMTRDKHSMTHIGGNRYLLFGGHNFDQYFSAIHVFDTGTLEWTSPETRGNRAPAARDGHTMVSLGDGRILLWGGSSGGENYFNDMWSLDPREMKWEKQEAKGKWPAPRSGHTMTLANGRVFVFGGLGIGDLFYNDTFMLSIGDDIEKLVKGIDTELSVRKSSPSHSNIMEKQQSKIIEQQSKIIEQQQQQHFPKPNSMHNSKKSKQFNFRQNGIQTPDNQTYHFHLTKAFSQNIRPRTYSIDENRSNFPFGIQIPNAYDYNSQHFISPTITNQEAKNPEAISRLYYEQNVLNFNDIIIDGFYDPGRSSSFLSFPEHQKEEVDVNSREILLVDINVDKPLETFRNNTVSTLKSIPDARTRVLLLSLMVSNLFGGSHNPNIVFENSLNIRQLKKRFKSNIIPIGFINYGLCRHRAIMFKYISDSLNIVEDDHNLMIYTRVVRGVYANPQEADEIGGHVWNIVRVYGTDYVLDVMFEPSKLQETRSWRSSNYFRIRRQKENLFIVGGTGASIHSTLGLEFMIDKARKDDLSEDSKDSNQDEKIINPNINTNNINDFQEILENSNNIQKTKNIEENNQLKNPKWEIKPKDFIRGEMIGVGEFGVVYKGKWLGIDIAIKTLLVQDLQENEIFEFKQDLMEISNLRHPKLVQFLGASFEPPNISIINEFIPKKTLRHILQNKKIEIQTSTALQWAIDIAKTMHYLHSCNPCVVHHDLKTDNILVGNDNSIKISDFGFLKTKKIIANKTNRGMGNPAFTAPEILKNEDYTNKSDIYSFGILLWEITTREIPFHQMNPLQLAIAVLSQGKRPTIPYSCPPQVAALIKSCWDEKPESRPTFEVVYQNLEKIDETLKKEPNDKN
eukprot:Anaeramoba_ignava/a610504_31.p1 GENE.a610504_31~~a610504_31.p1  ORF type:complete len:1030 (-),score=348.18 a610504_31:135-2972(-)